MRVYSEVATGGFELVADGEPIEPELTRQAANTCHTLGHCKACGFSKVVNGVCLVCQRRKAEDKYSARERLYGWTTNIGTS